VRGSETGDGYGQDPHNQRNNSTHHRHRKIYLPRKSARAKGGVTVGEREKERERDALTEKAHGPANQPETEESARQDTCVLRLLHCLDVVAVDLAGHTQESSQVMGKRYMYRLKHAFYACSPVMISYSLSSLAMYSIGQYHTDRISKELTDVTSRYEQTRILRLLLAGDIP